MEGGRIPTVRIRRRRLRLSASIPTTTRFLSLAMPPVVDSPGISGGTNSEDPTLESDVGLSCEGGGADGVRAIGSQADRSGEL